MAIKYSPFSFEEIYHLEFDKQQGISEDIKDHFYDDGENKKQTLLMMAIQRGLKQIAYTLLEDISKRHVTYLSFKLNHLDDKNRSAILLALQQFDFNIAMRIAEIEYLTLVPLNAITNETLPTVLMTALNIKYEEFALPLLPHLDQKNVSRKLT